MSLRRTVPAVLTGAVLGTLGTKPTSAWYRDLDRPSWEPPTVVFPVAWTSLYAATATAVARAMDATDSSSVRRDLERRLWANMALNAGWCWLFFTAHKPRLALAELLLLEASTADLARRCARVDAGAGALLAPYVGWNAFAAALNAEIVRRNG
ncbi:tryptophan-rich sensory protein [Marmoricola endophyticus]|uniref:Tryptophan-rich sensory protein n=1 Tax=Marmoricola endophyticus TaxID=2040280 RepID=A0A917BKL1_9ACTN|nr:TspO/MBR family protein [Marmoricola endophyticus]GGF46726.1 tryptophan-rich sensory protein [Marmoricola endophyticus]